MQVTGGANEPICTDIGTQVRCSGKVAGLGGTTFTITITAQGTASVEVAALRGRHGRER
jgi:hypothetical protein